MHTNKLTRLSLILLMVLSAGLIAWGNRHQIGGWLGNPAPAATDGKGKKDPVQSALIREMQALLSQFDSTHKDYYLDASFTALDKTDSMHALVNIPYTLCRKGNNVYFRFGETETLNADALNLYVDHAAGAILISEQKKVVQSGSLPFNELYSLVEDEGYVLAKTESGGRAVISMKSETHLSCKELQVHFDPVTNAVRKIFIRLPDISDNMNTSKEKTVSLVISKWTEQPGPSLMPGISRYVRADADGWSVTGEYKDYKLIRQ